MKDIEKPIAGFEVGDTPKMDLDIWLDQVRARLKEMNRDPWFSSLWTLQEAFLSPTAILMYKDGCLCDQFGYANVRTGRLMYLIYRWEEISDILKSLQDVETPWATRISQTRLKSLQAEIRNIGFLEAIRLGAVLFQSNEGRQTSSSPGPLPLNMGNPLMLLAASHERTTMFHTDRVRGIMQVFDLQLGESSPHAIPGKSYSLSELEDQLGSELLRRYPISSHLMVQSRSCPSRKAWRVNSSMTLIEEAHVLWRQISSQDNPLKVERDLVSHSYGAQLSPQQFEGLTMVHFKGRYSLLETLTDVLGDPIGFNDHIIILQLDTKWEEKLPSATSGSTIKHRLTWLTNALKGRNVGILSIAHVRPPRQAIRDGNIWSDWGIGLVLCQEQGRSNVYERIGVLIWDRHTMIDVIKITQKPLRPTAVSNWFDYLSGKQGEGWTSLRGYFG